MIWIITIVIILLSVVLGFFILVQNPKGGGLSGTFGSIGSQVMGVKQSGDVMEKGTWTSMGVIAALCIIAIMFYTTPKELKQTKQPAKSSTPAKQSTPAK
ncbi:MAG: preprotein translocase subunit SecG [Bacteroidetes bacterium]|nr:preprotein translocase subunit SecG [Bacteroidota bacterium]MBS1740302.1 preprotein translocase subunit SecG [Bacteroidota bacterium]MBS1775150.1 preprotein translocase subunit SecG [Bacteroidota bacterium]